MTYTVSSGTLNSTIPYHLCPNNAKLVGCGMGMGFAPTWLRQVSRLHPTSHDHFNHRY